MNLTHRDRRFISKARMLAQQAKSFTQGLYVWWTDVAKYLRPAYSQEKPPQYPIALDPTFIAQRMLVQHSHFTLHGHDTRGLDEMMKDLQLEDTLFKVLIRSEDESIKILRQRVALLGITETTIFPDLGGLGRELGIEYDLS